MYRTASLAFAFMLAAAAGALAQFPPQPAPPAMPGSEQERAACRPDVLKFCEAQVKANEGDVFGILACLKANRTRLSGACRQVLASNGQ